MLPAQAPLPADSSFPFQPDMGSHTSIPISESLTGFSNATTRQNAGSFSNTAFEFAAFPGVGGLNAPASIGIAETILVCGSARDARPSQVFAAAMAPPRAIEPSR